MHLLLSSTRINFQTGNNPLLKILHPSDSASMSPPKISWYRRKWHPTPNDTKSTPSPPSPDGSQGIWRLLLQIRQPSWTPSQAVLACRIYKTSELSPPLARQKIILHSWTHPQPWHNLRLYLSMPCWIRLLTTSTSTTHLPPCLHPNRSLLTNIS